MKKYNQLGISIATAIILVVGLAPAATSSSPGGPPTKAQIAKALKTPTTLTYWGWDLSAPASVTAFQLLHPAITIKYINAGVGGGEYLKLRTALAANSGVPDVAFISADAVPAFVQTKSILDISTMGAGTLQPLFVPASWSALVSGSQIFGFPVGANAVASWYRDDLFKAAGITTHPKTWDEFAAVAKVIKEKTGAYIANVSPNDGGMMFANFFQAGVVPFDWTAGSSEVTLRLNSPEMKKVASFWDNLIQSGVVSTVPAWTDQFYQALDKGKLATWQAGIWGAPVIDGTTKTSGKWKAAAWPQWVAGNKDGAIWSGGISDVVMKASKNPIAAYEFIKFRATDLAFAKDKNARWGWDPVLLRLLRDGEYLAKTNKFAGGQKVNAVFSNILKNVGPQWHFPPFMEFVYSSFVDTVGKAAADGTGMSAGLDAWQKKVADYATQQGFTVK